MQVGDLVTVSDKFGSKNYGVITGTVIMDEVLFVVTFFDGSDMVVHPTRIKLVPKEQDAKG